MDHGPGVQNFLKLSLQTFTVEVLLQTTCVILTESCRLLLLLFICRSEKSRC